MVHLGNAPIANISFTAIVTVQDALFANIAVMVTTSVNVQTADYEMQHDASIVPQDRITTGLCGTAAPLKTKYDDPFVAN